MRGAPSTVLTLAGCIGIGWGMCASCDFWVGDVCLAGASFCTVLPAIAGNVGNVTGTIDIPGNQMQDACDGNLRKFVVALHFKGIDQTWSEHNMERSRVLAPCPSSQTLSLLWIWVNTLFYEPFLVLLLAS